MGAGPATDELSDEMQTLGQHLHCSLVKDTTLGTQASHSQAPDPQKLSLVWLV